MRLAGKAVWAVAVLLTVRTAAATVDPPPARPRAAVGRHWAPVPGAPPAVWQFLAQLPTFRAILADAVDREVPEAKAQRTAVARCQRQSVQESPQAFQSLLVPVITRSDPSGDPDQRRRLRELDALIERLYALKRAALTDDLWLPDGSTVRPVVGWVGLLPPAAVRQAADGLTVLDTATGVTFQVTSPGPLNLRLPVRVTAVRTLPDPCGGSRTVLDCESFDVRRYLVAVTNAPPAVPPAASGE